jgi:proline iminopeptidase
MKNKLILLIAIMTFSYGVVSAQSDYFIVSKDGTRIHIQEFGKGEPVVFLAGGPGMNAVYMQPVWQRLSKNFRCVILNQRGTDSSLVSKIDSASLSMDNYVNDIEALRKHLQLKKITVLGHSWGGMLAMVYLAKEPDRVEKMILLDSGGPDTSFAKVFDTNLNKNLTKEDKDEIKRLDSLGFSTARGEWPGYFYDRKRALATQSGIPLKKGVLEHHEVFPFTAANYFAFSDSMKSALKKSKVPVFLIQGREDPMGESTAMDIKKVLPQTSIHFIEKCGHLPWLENEKQVNEFFEQVEKDLR